MRISDWSSDVCSSDLLAPAGVVLRPVALPGAVDAGVAVLHPGLHHRRAPRPAREHRPTQRIAVAAVDHLLAAGRAVRSEEHTSELQSLMRISYAVFCLKKKIDIKTTLNHQIRRIRHRIQ